MEKKQQIEGQSVFEGIWWLPESQDIKAPGKLTISSDGSPELDLHIFPQNNHLNFFQMRHLLVSLAGPPIKVRRLTGWLTNGKVAHLEEVILTCKGWHNGIYLFNGRSKFCVVSNLDFGTDEIETDRVYVKSEGLDEFIRKSGFHYEMPPPTDAQGEHRVHFTLPQNINLKTDNDLQIEVVHSFTVSPEAFRANIEQFTSLKLLTSTPRPIGDWLGDIASISFLLSVNLGRHLPLQSVEGRIDFEGKEEKIEVHFDHGILRSQGRPPHPMDCLVRYADDENGAGRFLYHFLKLRAEIAIIFGSFFSALSPEPQYIENRFFLMIRAIEGFHRQIRCNGNTKLKKMQTKQRMQSIFDEFNQVANASVKWSALADEVRKLRDQEVHILDLGENSDAQRMVDITHALLAIFAVIFIAEVAVRASFNLPEDWVKRCGWVEQRLSGINLSLT